METIIRLTPERRTADEWALVLISAGIDCRTETQGDRSVLVTASSDAARAATLLDVYERENPPRVERAVVPFDYGPTYVGVAIAVALIGFYGLTGPRDGGVLWFQRGSATADLILRGEVWRTVTALTLHADLSHVASNAVFCALFGTALCRAVGPGVGVWMMLLAGAGGNALNAVLRGAPHSAVGASTAILGALGSLGTLQFVNRSRLNVARWRAWIPIAAALGLLAMVGMGRDSDFLAHGFGFVVGSALGLWAGALRRVPTPWLQGVLTLTAFAAVIACWAIALR